MRRTGRARGRSCGAYCCLRHAAGAGTGRACPSGDRFEWDACSFLPESVVLLPFAFSPRDVSGLCRHGCGSVTALPPLGASVRTRAPPNPRISASEILMADKSDKMKARLPRGFVDRSAEDVRAADRMMATIRGVFELYGFEPVDQPLIEYTDA